MNKDGEKILKNYQSEYLRSVEELFAQILAEKDNLRLFFINENRAFTDGKNIVVDPAEDELFLDFDALYRTEEWMGVPHDLSNDPWLALHMITRAQNIHESLHIIYTQFPLIAGIDVRGTNKVRVKTLAMISNIIEDAFIEAVGCSEYDNLELYLTFGRVSRLFSNTPSEGTISQAFTDINADGRQVKILKDVLDYMATMLLYPMLKQSEATKEVGNYVELITPLFLNGSLCSNAKERYTYTQKVFDILEPLIPDDENDFKTPKLDAMLGGLKTHDPNASTIGTIETLPKDGNATRRLFANIDGQTQKQKDFRNQFSETINTFSDNKKRALKIVLYQGSKIDWQGSQFDGANIHRGITIEEKKPKVNLHLKKAYQNIYNRYHININSYNSRFDQLLKAPVPAKEERLLFGSGVDSKKLGDVKKRYWYKNTIEYLVPDIAVLLMIDGSGSMSGERRESAMTSAVILHEVLRKQGIEHAIVEHRAIYGKPIVQHNILVDLQAIDEEKYNILTLSAEEGTREGLSLFWAERYLQEHSTADEKLILVVSDGVPAHGLDDNSSYLPPVSIKDTANTVQKIQKRGTKIIAVALDEEEDTCYDQLKTIYSQVVRCTDLKYLTGQLLRVISKQF